MHEYITRQTSEALPPASPFHNADITFKSVSEVAARIMQALARIEAHLP